MPVPTRTQRSKAAGTQKRRCTGQLAATTSNVARALIDGGANIEAAGASIAGGSPLDDPVGYGCWQVARLLVAHGARVDRLWQAAALGIRSRVDELMAAEAPTTQQLTDAFWQGMPRRPAANG